MSPFVLQPKGVRYDIDNSDRSGRWSWILAGLVCLLVVAGLWIYLPGLRDWKSVGAPRQPPAERRAAAQTTPRHSLSQPDAELPATVPADIRRLVVGAEVACRADDLPSARRRYLEVLDQAELGTGAPYVERRLGEIGRMLILTPRPMPEKIEHEVVPGDSIEKIARRYGTTPELVMVSNDIRRADRLQAGRRLLVLNKPVLAVTIHRTTRELRLVLNGKFLKRYTIEMDPNGQTPIGSYAVRGRKGAPSVSGPVLRTGEPRPQGVRWIALQATGPTAIVRGFGIRSVSREDAPPVNAAVGSIHMRTSDLEELGLIVPDGTSVRIQE